MDRKFRLARVWSNQELARIAPAFGGAVVNVSAWQDSDKVSRRYRDYFGNADSYTVTNYPGHHGHQGGADERELDLTAALPEELRGRFDTVFNHTTLEHIFDVGTAFSNLCAMSRDAVIVVVPFAQIQHESASFGDYWRFTPTCLRELFARNGFEVVYEAANSPRNAAIYLLFVGVREASAWAGRLPAHQPIEVAGHLIGDRPLHARYRQLRRVAGRLLGRGAGRPSDAAEHGG